MSKHKGDGGFCVMDFTKPSSASYRGFHKAFATTVSGVLFIPLKTLQKRTLKTRVLKYSLGFFIEFFY